MAASVDLGYPGATIYLFTERAIARVPYKETEHYVIRKGFPNNPEGMPRELLSEPSDDGPEGGAA